MKKFEIDLEELSSSQLEEIIGGAEGGFIFDLGVAAHMAWNAFDEMASSVRSTHVKYGYIK
jgi:hypothetical protein